MNRRTFSQNKIRISESFNIYQATMTMLSIFTGFVFAALLQVLLAVGALDRMQEVVIWVLIVSLLCFLTAIFSFHHSAHRVVRYWNIFLPQSVFVRVGGLGLIAGFFSMLLSLSCLLYSKDMVAAAVIMLTAAIVLGVYALLSRQLHEPGAAYLGNVDDG